METARKKNISGEDLDVPILYPEVTMVKAGDEVDVPLYYPWHREPSGKEGEEGYDPGDSAPILWPETIWADVVTPKKASKAATSSETE